MYLLLGLEEWSIQLQAYIAWVNSQLRKYPGANLVQVRHDEIRLLTFSSI